MKPAESRRSRPRSARVVWDEANLDYLEANKSPKRKITEPKTPYYAPESIDGTVSPIIDEDVASFDNAVQAEQIRHALSEVASTSSSQRRPRGGGWTSSEDEADEMEQDSEGLEANGHSLSFLERRKAHYDEFRKVKMLRRRGSVEAEEEDSRSQDASQESQDHGRSLAGDMDAFGLEETALTETNCGKSCSHE